MVTSLILYNYIHNNINYEPFPSKVAMSHVDSKDDEVKSILAEIDSNDSKESDNSKTKKDVEIKEIKITTEKDNDGIEWETNTIESDDSEW